jgi:hypothetical protein
VSHHHWRDHPPSEAHSVSPLHVATRCEAETIALAGSEIVNRKLGAKVLVSAADCIRALEAEAAELPTLNTFGDGELERIHRGKGDLHGLRG